MNGVAISCLTSPVRRQAGNKRGTCARNVCISSDRACDIAVAVHLKRTAFRVRFCPLRLACIVLIQATTANTMCYALRAVPHRCHGDESLMIRCGRSLGRKLHTRRPTHGHGATSGWRHQQLPCCSSSRHPTRCRLWDRSRCEDSIQKHEGVRAGNGARWQGW